MSAVIDRLRNGITVAMLDLPTRTERGRLRYDSRGESNDELYTDFGSSLLSPGPVSLMTPP